MTFSFPACRNLKNKLVSHKEQWQVADWYIISTEVVPTNQTRRFWQFYWESESVRNLKGYTTKFKIYLCMKTPWNPSTVSVWLNLATVFKHLYTGDSSDLQQSALWSSPGRVLTNQHQSFVIKLPSLHLYKLMSGLFPSSGFLFLYPKWHKQRLQLKTGQKGEKCSWKAEAALFFSWRLKRKTS